MLTTESKSEIKKENLTVIDQYMCPDCRTIMSEVDRLTENVVLFIWDECTRDGCDSQRLEKRTCETGAA